MENVVKNTMEHEETIFIQPSDLRHGAHIHCRTGLERFCNRTGLDCDDLINGRVTVEQAVATGQYMGLEVARNARERVEAETAEIVGETIEANNGQ